MPKPEPNKVAADGSLTIDHGSKVDLENYELTEGEEQTELEQIHIDDQGHLKTVADTPAPETPATPASTAGHKVLQPLSPETPATSDAQPTDTPALAPLEPPTLGGTLTASGADNEMEKAVDPLAATGSTEGPLLSHDAPAKDQVLSTNTLTDIERSVSSPHLQQTTEQTTAEPLAADTPSAPPVGITVEEARANVDSLTSVSPGQPLPPIEALGAQYVDLPGVGGSAIPDNASMDSGAALASPEPTVPAESSNPVTPPVADDPVADPTAPPPVPPPMMPPSFTPSQTNS